MSGWIAQPERYTAAHAARDVAARHGVELPDQAAAAVAAAVLECADDEYRVSGYITPELWGRLEPMRVLRERLRRHLACDLADRELLPIALPREVVTKPREPWKPIKVELVVPVRSPSR